MFVNEAVRTAHALAKKGVEWDSGRKRADCPLCGIRAKVVTTKKLGGLRVRYHVCDNVTCLMHVLDLKMKSVEVLGD